MKILDIRNKVARHPTKKLSYRKLTDIRKIVVHHSLTRRGLAGSNAEAYFRYHVFTNGWSIGGYSYVIEPDGTIKWCADWNIITPHVGNHNKHCIGICLTGDFRVEDPTNVQYEALLWLIKYLQKELPNKCDVVGHSELPGYEWKPCPVISMNKVRSDLKGVSFEMQPWQRQAAYNAIEELDKKGLLPYHGKPEYWKEKVRNGTLEQELNWLAPVMWARAARK